MRTLQAINGAVVDFYHLLFAPLREGETGATADGPPYWVRASIGWALIAAFLGAFVWLR